jgi:hypothetical protein
MTSHIPRFDHGPHSQTHAIYAQRERKRDRYLKKTGDETLEIIGSPVEGLKASGDYMNLERLT